MPNPSQDPYLLMCACSQPVRSLPGTVSHLWRTYVLSQCPCWVRGCHTAQLRPQDRAVCMCSGQTWFFFSPQIIWIYSGLSQQTQGRPTGLCVLGAVTAIFPVSPCSLLVSALASPMPGICPPVSSSTPGATARCVSGKPWRHP